MIQLPLILLGAAFAVTSAYAWGCLAARRNPLPWPVVLAIGAAVFSTVVFALLLAGAASRAALGIAGLAPLAFLAGHPLDAPKLAANRLVRAAALGVFAVYGVLYFVHALAPEIQADGYTYHLGLVSEYLRDGGFSGRIGFYELLPHGMELIYLPAFAFGKHSAAKLVHLAFLAATPFLILAIGRRLDLPEGASLTAAVLYYCAPVVGVSGTSSYTDAALVLLALATFYLLLVWDQERDPRLAVLAGFAAGFCYAIKIPGLLVAAAAVAWAVIRMRRPPWRVLLGVCCAIVPWMVRAVLLTGNPVAPLMNRWFPNPFFHPTVDARMAGFASAGAASFWDLAVGGHLQGIIGPLFLAFPLGLLAVRSRTGRIILATALLLALPWLLNTGARFLMPALPFLALAFALALPRAAWPAVILVQAVTCWPWVVERYGPNLWQLRGFPLSAALRITSEHDYFWNELDDYKIASMVQSRAPQEANIFWLMSIPRAYVDRRGLEYWHNAEADRLLDAIRVALTAPPDCEWQARWPARPLHGIRIRMTQAAAGEFALNEVRLFLGDDRIASSPRWSLRATPNRWELPEAFDGNPATRWRTWRPAPANTMAEAAFDRPQVASALTLVTDGASCRMPLQIEARDADGKWRALAAQVRIVSQLQQNLRGWATRALKRAGFDYILAPTGPEGLGPAGEDLRDRRAEWGVEQAGGAGPVLLFHIR